MDDEGSIANQMEATMSEPLPFYSAGVNEDKSIAAIIKALEIGVVADTGCTLTAGQCAELLAELERLKRLLADERDMELPW